MDKAKIIARATRIKAILDDDDFKSILDEMVADTVKEWRNSGTIEDREAAWSRQKSIESLINLMKSKVNSGKLEQSRSKNK